MRTKLEVLTELLKELENESCPDNGDDGEWIVPWEDIERLFKYEIHLAKAEEIPPRSEAW